jgi:hypothetical protein
MASLKPSLMCEKQNMNLKSNVLIKTKGSIFTQPTDKSYHTLGGFLTFRPVHIDVCND